jgi:hypothetical protein
VPLNKGPWQTKALCVRSRQKAGIDTADVWRERVRGSAGLKRYCTIHFVGELPAEIAFLSAWIEFNMMPAWNRNQMKYSNLDKVVGSKGN